MNNLISIIICTCNRSQSLSKTLDSLLHQENLGALNYEVIVVDNNSKDDTRKMAESFIASFHGKLRYVFEPTQGKPYALNRGIREAKGEIVAFTDDDVIIERRWLQEIKTCFETHHCDGMGGRVLPIYPKNTPRWVRENPVKISGGVVIYDYGEVVSPHDPARYPFIGANFAFRKEVFEGCGMFRTDLIFGKRIALGEDSEFVRRLIKRNKILYYCGKAVVHHPVDLKRILFSNAARWSCALGHFDARIEFEEKKEGMVSLGGIPRYLCRGIIEDALRFPFSLRSNLGFFDWTRRFFRKIGMISEYLKLRKGEV